MVELVIEHVRDIHDDFEAAMSKEPSEPVHRINGAKGVKLSIQDIPIRFCRGEHSDNVFRLGKRVFHLKLQVFNNEEFQTLLLITDIVNSTQDNLLIQHYLEIL